MTKATAIIGSLFIAGLGFTLTSRYLLAVTMLFLFLVINAVFFWFRLVLTPNGLLTWALLVLILNLSVIFLIIKSKKMERKANWGAFSAHLAFFLSVVTLILFNHNKLLGVAVHYVPSNSMSPAIPAGNYVVSDTWVYKKQRARVGDVVLFQRKEASPVYLKRISSADSGVYELAGDNAYVTLPSLYFGNISHDLLLSQAKIKIDVENFSVSIIY